MRYPHPSRPQLRRRLLAFSLPLLLGLLGGCVDKFAPDVITAPNSFLVVDGSINLRGVTTVRLARTQNLRTTEAPPVETRATAAIQDEAGTRYPLAESAPGIYTSEPLTLDAGRRYQLRLRTAAGRDYASDLVAGKLTPPIDEVRWAVEPRGVQFYVSAHDPANATRYYRWRYEETWQFSTPYQSDIEFFEGRVRARTENISSCWTSANSTAIQLSTTEKLGQDVVSDFPLILLPENSVKLRIKYSVLVKQYAQTAEEHAYYENLRKNTESLGGLFDPQPTQLAGNVRCLQDAAEPVIGYVGATAAAERRIFVAAGLDLPPVRSETGYEFCEPLRTDSVKYFPTTNLLIYPVGSPIPYAYLTAPPSCADCRLRGTNKKPDFWP